MSRADAGVGLGLWSKPTLVGTVVTLRPYRAEDAEAVWEMLGDAEGRELTATTAEFTRAGVDEWVGSRASVPDRLDLAIVENATGDWAGEVVLNEMVPDADGRPCEANFRIALRGPGWYGRGLGTEATALMLAHAFERIGLTTVVLDVLARNPRAVRAYEKAGFVETSRQEEDGEEWIDMAITREQWASR
ncbi:GNAT family N-acetyltransferase [Demequina sp.]|uniref:GNAT family N-acetyltransferase n=1 Tax=Demequina sp. TaxID=2050685 RepID=UPI003A839356